MSKSTIISSNKKGYVASAVMSFVGMLAAVPVVMTLFSPNLPANASPNTGAAPSYDQFAYAYTQGYLASVGNTGALETCVDVGGMGSVGGAGSAGAAAVTPGASAVSASQAMPVTQQLMPGQGNVHLPNNGGSGNVSPQEISHVIRDSYNTYMDIRNHIYTNSNNTIGSNNSTSTAVAVSDSRNVHINTENTSSISNDVENTAINDSFNSDSHDTTTTNTSIAINESFNQDSNNSSTVVNDSYNTETEVENTTINHTEDSFNTVTENSNNTTELDLDLDLEINNEHPGGGPLIPLEELAL